MASEQAKKAIRRIDQVLVPFEGETEVILNAETYPLSDIDRKEVLSHFRGSGWKIDMVTRSEGHYAVHHAKLALVEFGP